MPRLLLTLATLGLAGSAYALMLKGWRGRRRRQADLPAPAAPGTGSVVLAGPVAGLFVGTTGADHWLDRVVAHQLSDRAAAELTVTADGVAVERSGPPALLVPWADLESADVETALGGKVVTTGMLVLTWRLGERRLRTAFRADARSEHEPLAAAITDRLTVEAAR